MNHFNYFTEIEDAFIRRRGKHLILSPVDWLLIESWEKKEIPLKIVLSAIDEVFDRIEADPKRSGQIRTLAFCKDPVESRYRSWKDSQIGKRSQSEAAADDVGDGSGSSKEENRDTEEIPDLHSETVEGHLRSLAVELNALLNVVPEGGLRDAILEAVNEIEGWLGQPQSHEKMAELLERLDENIDNALIASEDDKKIGDLRDRIDYELSGQKVLIDRETYQRTAGLILRKRLREKSGIPGLGLYNL